MKSQSVVICTDLHLSIFFRVMTAILFIWQNLLVSLTLFLLCYGFFQMMITG